MLLFKYLNFKKARITQCKYLLRKVTPSACACEEQISFAPPDSISACQVRASGSPPVSIRTRTVSWALGRAWWQGGSPNPEPQMFTVTIAQAGPVAHTCPKWLPRPCHWPLETSCPLMVGQGCVQWLRDPQTLNILDTQAGVRHSQTLPKRGIMVS